MNATFLMARQPIMDRESRLHAYELLYRPVDGASPVAMDAAEENQSLLTALVEVGLVRLAGDKLAFLTLSRRMLEGEGLSLLPPKKIVVEIPGSAEFDDAFGKQIGALRSAGYSVVFEGYSFQPAQAPFLDFVDTVKIDLCEVANSDLIKAVPALKAKGLTLAATNVENREAFDRCRALGFDLFQGYYFAKPETFSANGPDSKQIAVLRLLKELNHPEVTAAKLESAIALDPMLAARLLKLVNSAGFGASREIESVRVAIQMLGIARLQAFATVLAATKGDNEEGSELGRLGLIRARLCEKIALCYGEREPQKYFTIGLLSVLEPLMGIPMSQIVNQLSLSAEIAQALLVQKAGLGTLILQLSKAFEAGNWAILEKAKLNLPTLMETYSLAVDDATALSQA